jgi:hypothetical protein
MDCQGVYRRPAEHSHRIALILAAAQQFGSPVQLGRHSSGRRVGTSYVPDPRQRGRMSLQDRDYPICGFVRRADQFLDQRACTCPVVSFSHKHRCYLRPPTQRAPRIGSQVSLCFQ